MKGIKAVMVCGLSFSVLFSAASLIAYFGDWQRLAYVFFLGWFIGLIAAPEFEPGAFRSAWRFQVGSGVASGILLGLAFSFSVKEIAMLAVIGGILGWCAPVIVGGIGVPQ